MRSALINNRVYFLHTDRQNVVKIVLNPYSSKSELHWKEMKVKFVRERGFNGGELGRELCNCFWSEYGALMDGALDKVPQVLPQNQSSFYDIGGFISHGFLMGGFFRIHFSILTAKVIICGQKANEDDELCTFFSRFVDPFEAQALQSPTEEALKTVVVPMLRCLCYRHKG